MLCRDIYRCLPSELDEEDMYEIDLHLQLMELEAEIQKFGKSPGTSR